MKFSASFLLGGVALQDDLLLPSLVAYLLVADDRGQLLPICRRHGGLRHSFLGRALPLCDGTLELETATVTSNHARPCARSCVVRRLRGLEEGRTAAGAARRECDGRRARAMSVGPSFELASSSPPFALMWTMSRPSKSPCRPIGASPTPPSENAAPLLVPIGPEVSCSVTSPISVRFSTCACGAVHRVRVYRIPRYTRPVTPMHMPGRLQGRGTCYSRGVCDTYIVFMARSLSR